jgi:hypothetical protein
MRLREQSLPISLVASEQSIVQTLLLPAYSFGGQAATLLLRQFGQEILRTQCHKIDQHLSKVFG